PGASRRRSRRRSRRTAATPRTRVRPARSAPRRTCPRRDSTGRRRRRCETAAMDVEVRRLEGDELRAHLDGLADVLEDVVAGGASIGFMAPYSHEDARAFLAGCAAEVDAG